MGSPHERERYTVIRWLRDFLCGVLIGAGAILPGVSGGVLAVVFDVYRPCMEVLTRPRTAVPRYWHMLIPLGIGGAAGFLVFAKGISAALDVSATVTTWLFIGLIVGTVPALFREAGREGRSAAAWVTYPVSVRMPTLPFCSNVTSAMIQTSLKVWDRCAQGTKKNVKHLTMMRLKNANTPDGHLPPS